MLDKSSRNSPQSVLGCHTQMNEGRLHIRHSIDEITQQSVSIICCCSKNIIFGRVLIERPIWKETQVGSVLAR